MDELWGMGRNVVVFCGVWRDMQTWFWRDWLQRHAGTWWPVFRWPSVSFGQGSVLRMIEFSGCPPLAFQHWVWSCWSFKTMGRVLREWTRAGISSVARAHLTEPRTTEMGWSKSVKEEGRAWVYCVCGLSWTLWRHVWPDRCGSWKWAHARLSWEKIVMQRAELSALIYPKFWYVSISIASALILGKKKGVDSFTSSLVSFLGKVKNNKHEEVKFGPVLVLKMLSLYGSYGLGLAYTKNFLAISGSCPIPWAHACGTVSHPRMWPTCYRKTSRNKWSLGHGMEHPARDHCHSVIRDLGRVSQHPRVTGPRDCDLSLQTRPRKEVT